MNADSNSPQPITIAAFGPDIRHGFFTRAGGVSEGIRHALNCGFGAEDDPAAVTENRARALRAIGAERGNLATVYQKHTAEAVLVNEVWSDALRPVADAMVTKQPGIVLGILTADCTPVLFADEEAGIVAAAHAGWRGAVTGVLDATVALMVEQGSRPENIVAAVGPCIGRNSYEVGPEFPAPFLAENEAAELFFVPAKRPDHFLFDLPGYVAYRLRRLMLARVVSAGGDTCGEPERFFSYRRSVLRGEPDYGRLISLISLVP